MPPKKTPTVMPYRGPGSRPTGGGIIQPGAGRDRAAERNLTKLERDYVGNRKGEARRTAIEAVRRTRRKNKQKDLDD